MSCLLFFNELSAAPLAPNVREARCRMDCFIGTLQRVQHTLHGALPTLRSHMDIMDFELTADYPVARWLNDPAVEKDDRVWLKGLATLWRKR